MTPPAMLSSTNPHQKRRGKTLWIVIASVVGTLVVLAVIGANVGKARKVDPTEVTVTAANTYTAYRINQSGASSDSISIPQGSTYKVYCHETTGLNGSDKSFIVKVDDQTLLLIHDNQVSSVSGSGYQDCEKSMTRSQSSDFIQSHKVYAVLGTEH
jgi:hypothetical protein